MVFDSAGVLRDEGGSELARVAPADGPELALLTVGADTYEIVRKSALGRGIQLLDSSSQAVYDFHPGLRRGGVLALPSGEPAAQIVKRWWPGAGWRVVPEGREAIAVVRTQGLTGPVLGADAGLTAPALEISVAPPAGPAADLRLLLAFACWLIAGWEAQIPPMGAP